MNRQQNNIAKPPAQVVNWPFIICHFLGLPFELVLHNVKTFGVRAVSPRVGGALLLMFLFVAFHPDENVTPLICFMFAVVPLSIVAYISANRRLRRGEECHSRYTGRPYLMWLFPRWSEVTIKRLEPILVWAVGGIIHHFNHPLGSFVIAAAVGVAVRVGFEHRGNYVRTMNMNDAFIEQKIAMDSARKMRR
jgi:hypothetical protein